MIVKVDGQVLRCFQRDRQGGGYPHDDLGPSDEMREDESKMKELLNQTVEKANNLGK